MEKINNSAKEIIISRILNAMTPYLVDEALGTLKNVLIIEMHDYDLLEHQYEVLDNNANDKLRIYLTEVCHYKTYNYLQVIQTQKRQWDIIV